MQGANSKIITDVNGHEWRVNTQVNSSPLPPPNGIKYVVSVVGVEDNQPLFTVTAKGTGYAQCIFVEGAPDKQFTEKFMYMDSLTAEEATMLAVHVTSDVSQVVEAGLRETVNTYARNLEEGKSGEMKL